MNISAMIILQVWMVLFIPGLIAATQQGTCMEEKLCTNNGGDESDCQIINTTINKIISKHSNIPVNCTAVHIFVTSGTHELNGNLNFTDHVEEIRIIGEPGSQKSIVACSKDASIIFSKNRENNRVFLSNLVFTGCEIILRYPSFSLRNVAVMNSKGYGIYAQQSRMQEIHNCTFINNTLGHALLVVSEFVYADDTDVIVKLSEVRLLHSKGEYAVYIPVWYNVSVSIQNCTFSNNVNTALSIHSAKHVEITDCLITGNSGDGIYIYMWVGATINTSIVVSIKDCLVENNVGTGVTVDRDSKNVHVPMLAKISNTTFTNNSRALHVAFRSYFHDNEHRVTEISDCTFNRHKSSQQTNVVRIVNTFADRLKNNKVMLTKSLFVGNRGASALYVDKIIDFTIIDVDIHDNDCTAITLVASNMRIKKHLNITRNSGWLSGGISLLSGDVIVRPEYSQILLANSSTLSITDNTAGTYGGGIFSNETCNARSRNNTCFFKIEASFMTPIFMSGNRALIGGDSILGGCLSNCLIEINGTSTEIDKTDRNSVFWSFFPINKPLSQSTFVEYPKGAAFCKNTSTHITCNKSYTVSVFRGQTFNVSLIAGDELCYPSRKVLRIQREDTVSLLEQGELLQMQKYCHNYTFTLAGGLSQNGTKIQFSLLSEVPAILTVILKDCPPGLKLGKSTEQCICHNKFKLYKIVCHADHYTLEIPPQTWVGNYEGKIIAQKECQYCRNEMIEQPIDDTTDNLCTANRSGIMCGQCTEGYSLKLAGYECANCSKSPFVGVVLVVAFTCAGALLVLLLLRLDMTISTGALNGLIFYSNIVYLNSDIFLPTSMGGSIHLQNAVKILLTFLAWMNLDFGISTCFFDGYNTYISTWMQFVFPLYIWLLILIIVLASWYSTFVAKITTSNTVPVLATLLLLSYAKLLKTSIEAFSSVQLFSLDGELIETVWKQDGNIPFLGRYHLPLFLMSLLMVMFYIIPFTLLVLLGQLLRAKSHYRIFRWIHKIKPFLDAFYGCYTIRYRYWSGLLLLTRVAIIGIFSFYSTNYNPFKLMTISMMILMLFIFWILIGKTTTTSFYKKRTFNYLELFFLANLGTLSAVSRYSTQFTENTLRNQQVIAIVTVGSAFIVFCSIIAHQISILLLRFRVIRRINDSVQAKVKNLMGYKTPHGNMQLNDAAMQNTVSAAPAKPTHSEIDVWHDNELREPLMITEGESNN